MICQDRSCNNLCSAHPFRHWACSATGGPGDDEGTGDADDKSNVTVFNLSFMPADPMH